MVKNFLSKSSKIKNLILFMALKNDKVDEYGNIESNDDWNIEYNSHLEGNKKSPVQS